MNILYKKFYPNVSFNVIKELFLLFAEDIVKKMGNFEMWFFKKKRIQLVNGNFIIHKWKENNTGEKNIQIYHHQNIASTFLSIVNDCTFFYIFRLKVGNSVQRSKLESE